MSKIIILGVPAYGHVNPTLPVVQELVRRGEQVIYYNGEDFRSPIERTGARFRPYPSTGISKTQITKSIQAGNLANVSTLILRATEAQLPFLLEELRREQPDLVMFDSLALWGKMAATSLNLYAASSISHFVLDSGVGALPVTGRELLHYLWLVLPKLPGLIRARIRLRRRYKDSFPASSSIPALGGLNIVYTSRELHPNSRVIDETFRFVGPSINPQTRGEDFPFDLLTASTVVYISLGTIHTNAGFYRQCFEAFGDYPAQFILSVGSGTDIAALGEIPSNFIVRPSVPQLEVLQRANVFITHGGLNSIHEGLYYGVPLILIPQQFEQLLNARYIEAQNAGLVLNHQVIGGHIEAATLRSALDTVLAQPGYREAAIAVQQGLQATGGYRLAADAIQAYLAKREGALMPSG